ncbi:phage antirepressor KilAC domain-containing protein [Corynebacterium macclintockiae]|uniref:phage antirepressor KilAC domain-containing protein n=1 Tax=Corynebacterium macclintockiae TaxID=2913501 RepID=UPI00254BF2D5|nr:phage antirepressor KilAC domain-containing protein [Corynebacterium macclintockiae]MDK8889876.1 phage antirepressor KilAC domain-containing protein [Corynebacterium macclintockiae]
MNELIPIQDNDGAQAVLGRDLHKFLGIGKDYTTWFKDMTTYGFVAGRDFSPISGKTSPTGGRPRIDHIITLDMAKEISMIQRTDKGKQARQYFIECERQAKAPKIDGNSITRMELIQIAMNAEQERLALEAKAKELEPKAEAYSSFIEADGKYSVGAVAKMLGIGQNKLFRELRNAGVFIAKGGMKNTPYQQYMRHFEVKVYTITHNSGAESVRHTTYVQPSGIDFIRKKLGLLAIDPLPPAA